MHIPNGSQIFIESNRDTDVQATAISNAADPVFTVASGGTSFKKGDYVIITTSSWCRMVDRVLRVKQNGEETSVTLEGIDTTDQNIFPSGGTASFAKINSWVEIPCIQDLSRDGGEQQYYTYQCLSDDQEQQLPTYKSSVSLTYTFSHEFDNPIYPLLRKADEGGEVTALRMFVPKAKEMRCWAGVLSFNEIPQTNVNEMETVSLSVSLKGRFTFLSSDAQ